MTLATTIELAPRAAELLYAEARCLDEQRWQDWLELFEHDARFWVPSWRSEHELVSDPDTEVSFIHYDSRQRLQERVDRIVGGKSVTTLPLPRTQRLLGNVSVLQVDPADGDRPARWHVAAAFTVHSHDVRTERTTQLVGSYRYQLVCRGDRLTIAEKKVVVINDRVSTVMDIYTV